MNLVLATRSPLKCSAYSLLSIAQLVDGAFHTQRISLVRPYILLLMNGWVRILSGDELYRVEENTLIFMQSDVSQTLLLEPGSNGYLLIADTPGLMVEAQTFGSVAGNLSDEEAAGKLFQVKADRMELFTRLFDTIHEEIQMMRPHFSIFVEAQLIQLLILAERQCISRDLRQCPGESDELCGKLAQLIQVHFVEHKTVKFYARLLHLHPNHLNKLIKSYSGITVKDWIKNTVLAESRAMLIHTRLSVKEIAARLGFLSAHHLSKYFKRETSMTPGTFRKKHSLLKQV